MSSGEMALLMSDVFIGLGSNVGNREKNVIDAVELLRKEKGIMVKKVSSLYETEPEGVEDQEWFINAVANIETSIMPLELLRTLKNIESLMGRERTIRWGPRKIDMDILLYGSLVINCPDLTIPHPLMHRRAFVLVPLAEIAPEVIHPVLNESIRDLLLHLNSHKIVRKFIQR